MSDFVNMTDEETKYWKDFADGKPLAKYGPEKTVKRWNLSEEDIWFKITLSPASR